MTAMERSGVAWPGEMSDRGTGRRSEEEFGTLPL